MANMPEGSTPQILKMILEEIVLEKGKVSIGHLLPFWKMVSSRIEVRKLEELELRGMLLELILYVAQDQVVSDVVYVKWAKTWWDAFKARWFSDALLKRWPAEYATKKVVTQTIIRMCPHLDFDVKEEHLRWLVMTRKGLEL